MPGGLTNAIINNTLNNIFHAIWLCLLTQKPRYGKTWTMIFAALSVVISGVLSLFTLFTSGVEGTAFTLLYIIGVAVYTVIYVFFMNGEKILKSLFVFFTYVCVWAAVYLVSMLLFNHVFRDWESSVWIARTVFNVVLLLLYHFFFKDRVEKNSAAVEQASKSLIVISGMLCVLLPFLMIVYAFYEQSALSISVIVLLLIFTIAVYGLIFRFIKQTDREWLAQEIEMHNKVLLQEIEHFKKMESEVQKDRHDYRHHTQMLLQYAKNGDTQAIIDYLDDFEAQYERKFTRLCDNRIIDAVLRAYPRKAEQNNITLSIDAVVDSELNIEDSDVVAMLGNMLENALNAAMKAPAPRIIDVTVKKKGIKLILEVKNSANGNICFDNNIPKRSKGGGIGVKSIIYSAERYQGDVIFNYENGIFTCCAILNDIKPKQMKI